ncbi:MAG: hypothetical protein Q3976_01465 [Corynebacterium sp.]|nr:hypothetical protein [Corynebacterium sp.]
MYHVRRLGMLITISLLLAGYSTSNDPPVKELSAVEILEESSAMGNLATKSQSLLHEESLHAIALGDHIDGAASVGLEKRTLPQRPREVATTVFTHTDCPLESNL